MCKNEGTNDSNNVSNLKIEMFELKTDIIEKDLSKEEPSNSTRKNINLYEKFCNNNLGKDLNKLNIKELEKIYEDGNMILDLFYITQEKSNISQEDIIKVQYIISNVIYIMQNKKYKEQNIQTDAMQKKIESTTNQNKNTQKELHKANNSIKKIKSDVNSIITTIISIVLSISIITTAIAGIERIDPNYILPFTTTIIFFGMAMILFIYSIYKGKIPYRSYTIIILVAIIGIVLWIASINKWYDISRKGCSEEQNMKTHNNNEIINQNNKLK